MREGCRVPYRSHTEAQISWSGQNTLPAFKPPSTGLTRVGTRSNNFFFSFYHSQEDRISWQRVAIICNIHVVGKSRFETSSTAPLFLLVVLVAFASFKICKLWVCRSLMSANLAKMFSRETFSRIRIRRSNWIERDETRNKSKRWC